VTSHLPTSSGTRTVTDVKIEIQLLDELIVVSQHDVDQARREGDSPRGESALSGYRLRNVNYE
jgi:hypothetical protein